MLQMMNRRTAFTVIGSLAAFGGKADKVSGLDTARSETLDRYLAFLAHEHRAALKERYPGFRDWTGQWHDPEPPMLWLPKAPDIEAFVESRPPSSRAVTALNMLAFQAA